MGMAWSLAVRGTATFRTCRGPDTISRKPPSPRVGVPPARKGKEPPSAPQAGPTLQAQLHSNCRTKQAAAIDTICTTRTRTNTFRINACTPPRLKRSVLLVMAKAPNPMHTVPASGCMPKHPFACHQRCWRHTTHICRINIKLRATRQFVVFGRFSGFHLEIVNLAALDFRLLWLARPNHWPCVGSFAPVVDRLPRHRHWPSRPIRPTVAPCAPPMGAPPHPWPDR